MRSFLLILLVSIFTGSFAQNAPVTKSNYQLASRFSPRKIEKLVFTTSVDPHWLKKSDRFWYVYETTEGKNGTSLILRKERKNFCSIMPNSLRRSPVL
jgi:dipeptidyl-peptidase-4